MTTLVAMQRVSEADVQARILEWVRDRLGDLRHAEKRHHALLGHAWQPRTARAKYHGLARYTPADLATLARADGFGEPFVRFTLDLPPADIPDEVRARVAEHLAEADRLLRIG